MWVRDRFTEPIVSKKVAIVSLNQYAGGPGAHERPNEGMVNIPLIAQIYGQAARSDLLSYPPLALAEFYPGEREWFMTDEGLLFCKKIQQNFVDKDSSR